ncbi:MAG: hypothetical protein WDN76_06695 [Alphaproteobacteria bacterium]
MQERVAGDAAEQANSAIAHAWGMLAGATELASVDKLFASDPAAVAPRRGAGPHSSRRGRLRRHRR